MFGIGPEQRWQLLVIQESEKHMYLILKIHLRF